MGAHQIKTGEFYIPLSAKDIACRPKTEIDASCIPYDMFILAYSEIGKKCCTATGLFMDSTGREESAKALMSITSQGFVMGALRRIAGQQERSAVEAVYYKPTYL
jgi:hypothetical protein